MTQLTPAILRTCPHKLRCPDHSDKANNVINNNTEDEDDGIEVEDDKVCQVNEIPGDIVTTLEILRVTRLLMKRKKGWLVRDGIVLV